MRVPPTGCLDRRHPQGDRHNWFDKGGLKGKGWFSHPFFTVSAGLALRRNLLHW